MYTSVVLVSMFRSWEYILLLNAKFSGVNYLIRGVVCDSALFYEYCYFYSVIPVMILQLLIVSTVFMMWWQHIPPA